MEQNQTKIGLVITKKNHNTSRKRSHWENEDKKCTTMNEWIIFKKSGQVFFMMWQFRFCKSSRIENFVHLLLFLAKWFGFKFQKNVFLFFILYPFIYISPLFIFIVVLYIEQFCSVIKKFQDWMAHHDDHHRIIS